MPVITYDTKEAVPEPIRDIIVEKDGKFTVDVSPTAKLSEFRNNNIALNQRVEKIDARIKEIGEPLGIRSVADIEKDETFTTVKKTVGEMVELNRSYKGKKMVDESGLEAAIETRTKEMKQGYENQFSELNKKLQEKDGLISQKDERINSQTRRSELRSAFDQSEAGFRTEAFDDVEARASGTWKVKDGKLMALNADGSTIYGENAEPITMKEWLKKLATTAPHFLKSSSGGGAGGDGGGNNGFSQNDIDKMTFAEYEAAVKSGKIKMKGR